jgi:hypothetical protein
MDPSDPRRHYRQQAAEDLPLLPPHHGRDVCHPRQAPHATGLPPPSRHHPRPHIKVPHPICASGRPTCQSMFGSCRYTYRRLPYVSEVALHPKSWTLIYTGRGLDAIDPSIIPILPFYMVSRD